MNPNQLDLLPDEFRSYDFNQGRTLRNILRTHCYDGRRSRVRQIDLDPTYGFGNFYRDGQVPQPRFKSDLYMRGPRSRYSDVLRADFRALPFKSGSMRTIVFDPPFLFKKETGVYKHTIQYGCWEKLREHDY